MARVKTSVNLCPFLALLRAPLADGGLALSNSEAAWTAEELLRFFALLVRSQRARARKRGTGP